MGSDNPRVAQVKVLWDKGWGTALGFYSLKTYRESVCALVGKIPEHPPVDYLNQLILVDRRVQLFAGCRMAGLKFDGTNKQFKPYDPKIAKSHGEVYWMWCQDGRRNLNKKPSDCTTEFAKLTTGCEVGLDEFEFVAMYAQDPTVCDHHFVDLPGAVDAVISGGIGCGGYYGGTPNLLSDRRNNAHPKYGSGSRWHAG